MTFNSTVCATYTYGIIVNTNLIQVTYKNITFLDLANSSVNYMYNENFSVQYLS